MAESGSRRAARPADLPVRRANRFRTTLARAARGHDDLVNQLNALCSLKYVQGLLHFTPNILPLLLGKRRGQVAQSWGGSLEIADAFLG